MSQYRIGSVNVVNGDATVTGVGTLFVANVAIGDMFSVAGSGVPYFVGSVTDDTHLELSANYAGVTANAQAYFITRDFTATQDFPLMAQGDIDTPTIHNRFVQQMETLLGGSFGGLTLAALTLATGTIVVSTPALTRTQTWNDAGVTFIGSDTNITVTAAAAASLVERWRVGGTELLSLRKDGLLTAHTLTVSTGPLTASGGDIFVNHATEPHIRLQVAGITHGWVYTQGSSSLLFGTGTGGAIQTAVINTVSSSSYITLTGAAAAGSVGGTLSTSDARSLAITPAVVMAGNLTVSGTTVNMTASGTTLTVGVGADNGTVSAGVFTDRTKYFSGDALAELAAIVSKDGEIDHAMLPEFATATVTKDVLEDGVKVGETQAIERDLGAMISLLTVGVNQLAAFKARAIQEFPQLATIH